MLCYHSMIDCNILFNLLHVRKISHPDNFAWPQAETLPADIQKVCRYNGINWIHDYQDACIAKIVRFIKGETGNQRRLVVIEEDR